MKNISKSILWMAAFALIALSSCQKEHLNPTDEAIIQSESPLSQERFTLEQVYDLPTDQMEDADILGIYNILMDGLDHEQKEQLSGMVAQIQLASEEVHDPVSGSTSRSETLLSKGATGDGFGQQVVANGNTTFIASNDKVHIYRKTFSGFTETQVITVPGGIGASSQALSVSGSWLAVASSGSNSVYLYKKSGSNWNAAGSFNFAGSFMRDVAIYGSRLAILTQPEGGTGTVINMYKRNGNNWVSDGQLAASDDIFFWDIDMTTNRVVGNGGAGPSGPLFAPTVYVYENDGSSWNETAQIPLAPGSFLLRAVAVFGNTIIANTAFRFGAPSNESFVYELQGSSWMNTGVLTQPTPVPFVQTRWIALEGNKAAVALGTEFGDPTDAVHVFEKSGSSWNLTETLTPSGGGLSHVFGFNIYIERGEVYVGAPNDFFAPPAAGNAYIYR